MKRAILDTDILSEILKGRNASVWAIATGYRELFPRFTTSSITVMEIVQGLHKRSAPALVERFLKFTADAEILNFDTSAAVIAGKIFAELKQLGQSIGRADPMIAAIAIQHELVLATANVDHFQRISALGYTLELANWRSPVT